MMQMLLSHWSICTSSIWTILLLLSYGNTETFDFTKCDITDDFRSEFVSASFKSLNAGLGCETNATSTAGQAVHIIAVDPPASSDSQGKITVKLSIHSRRQANLEEAEGVDFHEDPGPVVFVLHSSLPARWKIEMHGISSQEKHIFMLSDKSSIRFQRKRTRMIAKSRKRVLPITADNHTIFLWTQRRFGGVTSFSLTNEVNLKFYIGRDANASSSCNLSALRPSLRIFSYQEVVKPITGCVSKRRNSHARTKPVYIIELLDPPSPSPGITGIDLEIMPYNEETKSKGQYNIEDYWNFYLVVKSPAGLTWNLHSKKISGWVDIVADSGADVKATGVKISTVALREDDINATGRQLVEWSQDYIAPVQMYAGIHAANTIKLMVPPLEKSMASTRDRLATADQVDTKDERSGMWEDEFENGNKYNNLYSLIQTTCTGQTMEVTISKKFFQMSGLDKTKVSLKDPSCGPTAETDENIILCTGLTQCGTQSISVDDVTTISNDLVIPTSPGLVNSLLQDELGSGFFDDDVGSASHDLSLLIDDEDFGTNPFRIPVKCRLPGPMEANMALSDPSKQQCMHKDLRPTPTCNMNIYSTGLFLRPRKEFPATVAKGSYLYVKATVDQDITILIESCWFSTSVGLSDKSAKIKELVSQGCRKDSSFSWLDDPSVDPHSTNIRYTKFRVKVTDMFGGLTPLYLHCQFRTCQMKTGLNSQRCSVDENARCHQSVQPAINSVLPSDCGPLTIGPLDLTDKEIHVKFATSGSVTKSVNNHEEQNHSQQQRVIIEGLDSATVVGIAFAAFAIGILLTGALWFIHSHTGPVKQEVATHREADASGDMTPNSSSPMTA